jgi:hypothetical protein
MLSAQFEASRVALPPPFVGEWATRGDAMPDDSHARQPSQPEMSRAMPTPPEYDDRRREHEDRVIAAVEQMGSSLGNQIAGVRTELRDALRDNKADADGWRKDFESRLRELEKAAAGQSGRNGLIAGVLGVAGAGLLEIIYAMIGHGK